MEFNHAVSDVPYPTQGPKKTPPASNWKQATSTRFDSYEAAREAYDASDAERKRVRRRPGGHFDFVVYARLVKPKKEKIDEQLPEVQSGSDVGTDLPKPDDKRSTRRKKRKS
jgi:hypothetical protein